MVLPAIIGGGILLAIVFYFSSNIKNFLNKDDKDFLSEKQSLKRDQKGAINNTIDFFYGEGSHKQSKSSKLSGKTISYQDGSTISIPSDNVINPDGTVSGSPPLLSIPESQKKAILSRRRQNG